MTIDESRLRLSLSLSTPILLALIALGVALGEGPLWAILLFGGSAIALGWFVVYDFALSIDIDDRRIQRRCLARRQDIPWVEIDRFIRTGRKGLVAVTGDGKHHILVDRRLTDEELSAVKVRARQHGITLEN